MNSSWTYKQAGGTYKTLSITIFPGKRNVSEGFSKQSKKNTHWKHIQAERDTDFHSVAGLGQIGFGQNGHQIGGST